MNIGVLRFQSNRVLPTTMGVKVYIFVLLCVIAATCVLSAHSRPQQSLQQQQQRQSLQHASPQSNLLIDSDASWREHSVRGVMEERSSENNNVPSSSSPSTITRNRKKGIELAEERLSIHELAEEEEVEEDDASDLLVEGEAAEAEEIEELLEIEDEKEENQEENEITTLGVLFDEEVRDATCTALRFIEERNTFGTTKPTIMHVKTHKTASSTISGIVLRTANNNHYDMKDALGRNEDHFHRLWVAAKKHIKPQAYAFVSHMERHTIEEKLTQKVNSQLRHPLVWITSTRNPPDRLISQYRYQNKEDEELMEDTDKEMAWVENELPNPLTAFIKPSGVDDGDTAAIIDAYDHVIVEERFVDSVLAMMIKFGLSFNDIMSVPSKESGSAWKFRASNEVKTLRPDPGLIGSPQKVKDFFDGLKEQLSDDYAIQDLATTRLDSWIEEQNQTIWSSLHTIYQTVSDVTSIECHDVMSNMMKNERDCFFRDFGCCKTGLTTVYQRLMGQANERCGGGFDVPPIVSVDVESVYDDTAAPLAEEQQQSSRQKLLQQLRDATEVNQKHPFSEANVGQMQQAHFQRQKKWQDKVKAAPRGKNGKTSKGRKAKAPWRRKGKVSMLRKQQ
eukprot:TRINITY_DN6921_c0_g1_i1.p1 TRINITY_DN6921_c0_g1~~TRINITY_DN6921_c0_g1_i1.p1  ORF type:complete len:620 (+),score=150.91 TRINITY_DN6921_c0_g1_i1:130-1989(+)